MQNNLKELNKVFLEQGMQFYMCDSINYITNPELSPYFDKSYFSNYNVSGKINIYYTDFLDYSKRGFASLGPTTDGNVVIQLGAPSMVIIHEMGHYFNLLHTHDTAYGKELVNGTNCSIAGDLICDTPADPGLLFKTSNCVYNGNEEDGNGQKYNPDGHNYMSYSTDYCLDHFSEQQKKRMRYYYLDSTNKCNF